MNPDPLVQKISARAIFPGPGRIEIIAASTSGVAVRLVMAESPAAAEKTFHSGTLLNLIDYAANAAATAALPPGKVANATAMQVSYLVSRDYPEVLAKTRLLQCDQSTVLVAVEAVTAENFGSVPCAVGTVTLRVTE